MRIDLERAMRAVAGAAESAASPVPVDRLLARVHRLRVVRGATTGTVAVGALAAVAVGATQLDRGTTTERPAVSDWTTPSCGDPVELYGPSADLELSGSPAVPEIEAGGRPVVQVQVALANHGATVVDLTDTTAPTLYVLKDGVVVNDAWNKGGGQEGSGSVEPGGVHPYWYDLDLMSCDEPGTFLDPGEYEVVAVQEFRDWSSVADAATDAPQPYQVISAGPWPLAITGEPVDELARSEAQLEALVAAAPQAEFPECPSLVPTGAGPIAAGLTLSQSVHATDEQISGTVTLRGPDTGGVTVTAPSNAWLVVTRDGVVVSGQVLDPAGPVSLGLAHDHETELPANGSTYACRFPTSEGTLEVLPPGRYEVYATIDVTIVEVSGTALGGRESGDVVTLVSDPVTITVD